VEIEDQSREEIVRRAYNRGVDRYISTRKEKVPQFIAHHYSFRGALKLHAHALGWDLLRVPINIIWSVVNLFLGVIGWITRITGPKRDRAYAELGWWRYRNDLA
jgi:hypothetical protein